MPSPQALAHIEAQRRLRQATVSATDRLWRSLPAYNEEDLAQWLASVVPLIDASQRHSISLTDAFVARALRRPPLGVQPDDVTSRLRNGTPTEEVYRRPFVAVWTSLKGGTEYLDAVNAGLARATGSAAMDVALASRGAFQEIQNLDSGIYGYQRVPDGGACSFCLGVAGAYVKKADASPLHNHCGCSLEPLTAPHPRAAKLPSGEAVTDRYAIREHGELGAVLTDPADSFTHI